MPGMLRIALLVAGLLALVFAVGFFLQAPWATGIWPVQSSRLSNIFVSSILAAIGAPIVWIALSGETRAMAGGAVNLVLANGGIALAAFVFHQRGGPPALLPFAVFAAVLVALCAGLFIYSQRFGVSGRAAHAVIGANFVRRI